jgi:serine/threonine protein kinase/WD40 repeat protein
LLAELLRLELAIRTAAGESPTFEEYEARFPAAAALLAQAMPMAPPRPASAVQTESISRDGETLSSLPRPGDEPDAPRELGDYILLDRLGAGGMGQVFKAQHKHMKRLVAIKLLPAALTQDEAAIRRFQREVEAAARLVHANIVQAYDASVQRGVWYLVLEYVDGRDLEAVLLARGPLPVDEAVDYVLQAAYGLAYAHKAGLVHRDIKPANLMLCRSPSGDVRGEGSRSSSAEAKQSALIKILDMGLARIDAAEPADSQLTHAGDMMGTIDYMAPEQAANTREADARSDLYSLGCTLYRLLTNESVYEGETIVKRILAHTSAPIPSLRDRRPDVPEELDRICQKLLAKRREDRYQTASDLIAELEKLIDPVAPRHDGSDASEQSQDPALNERRLTPGKKSPSADRADQPGRRRTFSLLAVAAGLLLLFVCYGVWVIVRDKDGNEIGRMKVPDGGSAALHTENGDMPVPAANPHTPGSPPAARSQTGGTPATIAGDSMFAGNGLTPGDYATALSGLLPAPPQIEGIKRWNVDTRQPRGPGPVSWSPDSKQIAAATDRQLRIYAAPELTLERIVADAEFPIEVVAWSADGKTIAYFDSELVRLVDTQTLKPGPILKGHKDRVKYLAWSHDGRLASSNGGEVRIWSASGEPLRVIAMGGAINDMLWRPNSGMIFTYFWGSGGAATVWDADTGIRIYQIAHQGEQRWTWSPDGAELVACRRNKISSAIHYHAETGEQKSETSFSDGIDAASIIPHPHGNAWLVRGRGSNFRYYDALGNRQPQGGLREFQHIASQIVFSPDGKWLVSSASDFPMVVYKMETDRVGAVVSRPSGERISTVAFNPSRPILATHLGASSCIWDIGDEPGADVMSNDVGIARAWHPDGVQLVVHSHFQHGRVWDALKGKEIAQLPDSTDLAVYRYATDGSMLAGVGRGKVVVWDAATYETIGSYPQPDANPPLTGFTGYPPLICLGDALMNPKDGAIVRRATTSNVLFSPDATQLVTKGPGEILNFETTDGSRRASTRKLAKLPHDFRASPVVWLNRLVSTWSSDSHFFATHLDGDATVIFSADGANRALLIARSTASQYPQSLVGLDFSPDAAKLATISWDQTLRVWDIDRGVQEFVGVHYGPERAAILDEHGEIVFGDKQAVEEEFIYLVERENGTIDHLSPTDFRTTLEKLK